MYSPRSVSTGRTPARLEGGVEPDLLARPSTSTSRPSRHPRGGRCRRRTRVASLGGRRRGARGRPSPRTRPGTPRAGGPGRRSCACGSHEPRSRSASTSASSPQARSRPDMSLPVPTSSGGLQVIVGERLAEARAAAKSVTAGPAASAVARWTTAGPPVRSLRAREVHEAARVGGDERLDAAAGRVAELVVGHRHRDLRLAYRERAAEAAAEIGPPERHDRRARRLEQRAAARPRSASSRSMWQESW